MLPPCLKELCKFLPCLWMKCQLPTAGIHSPSGSGLQNRFLFHLPCLSSATCQTGTPSLIRGLSHISNFMPPSYMKWPTPPLPSEIQIAYQQRLRCYLLQEVFLVNPSLWTSPSCTSISRARCSSLPPSSHLGVNLFLLPPWWVATWFLIVVADTEGRESTKQKEGMIQWLRGSKVQFQWWICFQSFLISLHKTSSSLLKRREVLVSPSHPNSFLGWGGSGLGCNSLL